MTPTAAADPMSGPNRLAQFGVFEVDLHACELRKQGRKIRLQKQPCQVLSILLDHPGEVITREEFRSRLWSSDTFVDFDHSLNTAVMRLREVLADSSENPLFIETLQRRGYRFIAPVTVVATHHQAERELPVPLGIDRAQGEISHEAPIFKPADLTLPGETPRTRKLPAIWCYTVAWGWLMAAALIGLAAGFTLHYANRPAPSRPKLDQVRSLVVLPLENLSGDKDEDYFADGMSDELIASLAKVRSLRVISRTSSMEYKGTHKSLSEIARELNVDAVVEGTVLRSHDRVRITAELVQISSDRALWAETYESELDDILSLQQRVASAIVSHIQIELTPQEQRQLVASRPVSSEAYEDYLKGKYYWNKRSEAGLTKAIEYFLLATKKEPDYALAYAGLADCYGIIGAAIVGTVPAKDVAPKALAAAMKAMQIDPSLAEAQTSLATVRLNYNWDWPGAETGFKHAIELNPSYATAHQRYSLYLIAMGRSQESIAEMQRALWLDPLSISMNFSLGWRLYMARRYDEAIQQLRNTTDMDPTFALAHMVLGQAYEQKAEYPLAIAEFQTAMAASHNSPPMVAALAHVYAISGRQSEARRLLERLKQRSKQQYVSPFYIALVCAGLGENDEAVRWLQSAYADRSNPVIFLKVDPEIDGLRTNTGFQKLLNQLGYGSAPVGIGS
jgi:TolB-like protein/DNA-binding winged helix-turn-helix (wHTH) protein/Tfp pilus assembly protein PilF